MKIKPLLISFILVFSMLAAFAPSEALACSCAEPRPAQEEMENSEAVFAGRVLESKQQNRSGMLVNRVRFEVLRIWKGGPESQVIIYTGSGGGDCGIDFKEGMQYLVYANSSDMYTGKQALTTTICNRTMPLSDAAEDLSILGEGKVPTKEISLQDDFLPVYVWLGIVVVVFLGILVYLIRRK